MSVQTQSRPQSSMCRRDNHPTLYPGDQGPAVNEMRRLLADTNRGYGHAGITIGDGFTDTIEQIVKDFQAQVFLVADGIVGPKTWKALCADAPVDMPELSKGSTGKAVQQAQERLQIACQYSGAIDGDFGPETDRAVRNFQHSRNLIVDGILGPQTWKSLSYVSTTAC